MDESKNRKNHYPKIPKSVNSERLPIDKIQLIIKDELPEWKLLKSLLPENPFKERNELYREFKFKSFTYAIKFMNSVANGCDMLNHHPRWENIWTTVIVYTTTWQIGYNISDKDMKLAKYFDKEFNKFKGAIHSYHKSDKIKLPSHSFVLQLKELIVKNKLLEATEKLKVYFLLNSKNDKLNEVFQFMTSVNMLKNEQINSAISIHEYNLKCNKLSKQLLKFINIELEK